MRLSLVVSLVLLSQPSMAGEPTLKHWPGDYRHLHLRQAEAASAGRFGAIPEMCQKMLADYPHDGESLFFLGLAYAQLGQADQARETIDQALEVGLPPGRFLAGPRNWVTSIPKSSTKFSLSTTSQSTHSDCG